ncbi:hypothetical protein HWE04_22090 [Herbaspirillum sp. C7C2]|uniref:hypothetical protein n=1 Tax=Herbaspirillum sp. C7C2 TaxID=2736666 RepID=UPI001F5240C4|nr:hypothetical protein [Herbaspirillum sp. C7C2]MCI1016562.1 hypothetical protein [Herbaspirillum sp. C7C2]
MLPWLILMSCAVLALFAADRAWLRHVSREDRPLHDPEGYLEMTARMTELCHGDRGRVDALLALQRQRHPQATQAEVVRLAMRELLEPQSSSAP